MESVGAIIGGQGVLFALQGKLPLRNAVAVTTYQASKKRVVLYVPLQIVIAEHNVAHHAVAIRDFE